MDENTRLYVLFLAIRVGDNSPRPVGDTAWGLVSKGVENPTWNAVARISAVPIRDVVSKTLLGMSNDT